MSDENDSGSSEEKVLTKGGISFHAWPSIELLHNVVTGVNRSKTWPTDPKNPRPGTHLEPYNIALDRDIIYRTKIKLHGSNAAITIQDGKLETQSRTQFTGKTQAGEVVYQKPGFEPYFISLAKDVPAGKKFTIFGEWAGPGIQKGVALASLKQKIFAVFAIGIDDSIIYDPEDITRIMTIGGTVALPPRVYILPWHTSTPAATPATSDSYTFAYGDEKKYESVVETINGVVAGIDREDPWVKSVFNVSGNGEGLVLYPISLATTDTTTTPPTSRLSTTLFGAFAFKAKGEAHRTVAGSKAAQIKPQTSDNAEKLADMFLTEARLSQGASEAGGFDAKNVGKFVAWIKKDVEKESKAELEASNLEFKAINPFVTKKASTWFMAKVNAAAPSKKPAKSAATDDE